MLPGGRERRKVALEDRDSDSRELPSTWAPPTCEHACRQDAGEFGQQPHGCGCSPTTRSARRNHTACEHMSCCCSPPRRLCPKQYCSTAVPLTCGMPPSLRWRGLTLRDSIPLKLGVLNALLMPRPVCAASTAAGVPPSRGAPPAGTAPPAVRAPAPAPPPPPPPPPRRLLGPVPSPSFPKVVALLPCHTLGVLVPGELCAHRERLRQAQAPAEHRPQRGRHGVAESVQACAQWQQLCLCGMQDWARLEGKVGCPRLVPSPQDDTHACAHLSIHGRRHAGRLLPGRQQLL